MVRGAGRGRGRGRNFRGRGRGRIGHHISHNNQNESVTVDQNKEEDLYDWNADNDTAIDVKIQQLFIANGKFISHYQAQEKFPQRYFACLHVLITNHVQILENSKSLALAAVWARKDYAMAEFLLTIPGEMFHVKEVLKAVTILDAARNKRAHEKILKRLQAQGCKKSCKMSLIKSMIGSLGAEAVTVGSLSGALIRHIKLWLKTIPVERLEFFAMHFPSEPWKKLADLLHLHPERDMPQCHWFLPFCFGKQEIPVDSLASKTSNLNGDNISAKVLSEDIDYTVARKFREFLTGEAKERIARYSKVDTVLWYYEELECLGVDKVLYDRLSGGEKVELSYGKLMERILYFKYTKRQEIGEEGVVAESYMPILLSEAERRLKEITLNVESPVVVIGDMSGSMNVAIRTSNIIASLMTSITNADLVFFDTENVKPSFLPKDVDGVLRLCDEIHARGGTTPAVSLYPYYQKKEVVKTFFIVTDEGENGQHLGQNFADLFKKYYHEVYPARLVFISFLYQTDKGQMVTSLKTTAPEIKPMQFRFDGQRPDLSKLDNVFGLLARDTDEFTRKIDEVEKYFIQKDISTAIAQLKF